MAGGLVIFMRARFQASKNKVSNYPIVVEN
jgi:hypothetical protein